MLCPAHAGVHRAARRIGQPQRHRRGRRQRRHRLHAQRGRPPEARACVLQQQPRDKKKIKNKIPEQNREKKRNRKKKRRRSFTVAAAPYADDTGTVVPAVDSLGLFSASFAPLLKVCILFIPGYYSTHSSMCSFSLRVALLSAAHFD